jgi:hypothetical protein
VERWSAEIFKDTWTSFDLKEKSFRNRYTGDTLWIDGLLSSVGPMDFQISRRAKTRPKPSGPGEDNVLKKSS